MKKFIIAISFLAMTAVAFAGNNNTKVITPEARLDASIQDQVAYPHFLEERVGEHSAEIHFTLNANGTINVKDIVCEESDLKDNLNYQLKTFVINTSGLDLTSTYKIVLRFKTLVQD